MYVMCHSHTPPMQDRGAHSPDLWRLQTLPQLPQDRGVVQRASLHN
jgi:hypothetical protein